MIYRTAPFSMTYTPGIKVTPFFDAEYLRNGTRYRHSLNTTGNVDLHMPYSILSFECPGMTVTQQNIQ